MSMIEFSIMGADTLSETIKSIGYEMKVKSGRFAVRKAAEVIAEQARANALAIDDPLTPEAIHLNVQARWNGRKFRATGDLAFRIGIMGGAGGNKTASELSVNPGGDTRHWRYVEFGTQDAQAKPFFRRAINESANLATRTLIVNFEKSIQRAIKRANKGRS